MNYQEQQSGYIENYINTDKSDIIIQNNIKIATMGKIMCSHVVGNMFIGQASCINRIESGRYIGIAYFSYMSDCVVGNYCTFGSRVSIGAFSHPVDGLTIHEFGYRNTMASYGETVLDRDSDDYLSERSRQTRIGNDVWVGDNSVVIKGVKINNGAIVAAGSVVTRDVEPYSIVAGNPARLIRNRFDNDIVERLQATRWWEFSMSELRGMPLHDMLSCLEKLESIRRRRQSQ